MKSEKQGKATLEAPIDLSYSLSTVIIAANFMMAFLIGLCCIEAYLKESFVFSRHEFPYISDILGGPPLN